MREVGDLHRVGGWIWQQDLRRDLEVGGDVQELEGSGRQSGCSSSGSLATTTLGWCATCSEWTRSVAL